MEDYYFKSKPKKFSFSQSSIDFLKSTSLYVKWHQCNYYLYKYIDDFIINIKRVSKTVDRREQKSYYILSALFAFANYPMYRFYFEFSFRALDPKNVNTIYPNFTTISKDIRKNSRLYAGFSGFLTGYMVSLSSLFFDKYFNPQNGIYLFAFYHLLSLSIAYPYFLNSNYKMLKSPKYLSFRRHPFKYIQLIFNKEFYFGYRDWFIVNLLIFVPFVNLKAYKYESFRICRIAAHMFKDGENQLKEIEKNIILRPNHKHYGKFLFNIYPIVYNIFCVFQVWLLICFYDRAGNYVNLWRKDDTARYREAMERKYPPRPNERYLNLFGSYREQIEDKGKVEEPTYYVDDNVDDDDEDE